MLIATFEGNPAVKEFKSVQFGPEEVLYVIFQKEVVQFFTDDLTDIYGLCSTLYQDIAKDVFENVGGVFFCTSNNAVSSLFMPNYSLTSSCISLS